MMMMMMMMELCCTKFVLIFVRAEYRFFPLCLSNVNCFSVNGRKVMHQDHQEAETKRVIVGPEVQVGMRAGVSDITSPSYRTTYFLLLITLSIIFSINLLIVRSTVQNTNKKNSL